MCITYYLKNLKSLSIIAYLRSYHLLKNKNLERSNHRIWKRRMFFDKRIVIYYLYAKIMKKLKK